MRENRRAKTPGNLVKRKSGKFECREPGNKAERAKVSPKANSSRQKGGGQSL